jgi:hypothetical protein
MEVLIGALVRHALTAAAGAGFVVSTDLQGHIISALVGLATIGWSFYQKKKAK